MSVWPTVDPTCASCPGTPQVATIIDARPRDVGGFAGDEAEFMPLPE